MTPAKLVQVHVAMADRRDGRLLYEAIVDLCRTLHIAGATVVRGVEGFGEKSAVHKEQFIGSDAPAVVTIVDSDEMIATLLPALEQMVDSRLIIVSLVQTRRIKKSL